MFRWLLSLSLLALFSVSVSAQIAPDKVLASMTAGAGLQVELFASEPMVINPTAMDVDEQGRVWISEAVNYRRKNFNRPILRPEGDRIQVLIDETGAGKATKAVTFYQGTELYGPLSVLVIPQVKDGKAKGYRVLVAQSPDILEFTDADGDLKADGPPKKFLTGFGGFDHDHGVHGLHMGPDGKLYFTVGDSGVTGLQSADGRGKKFVSNNTDVQKGTVWRCDLQGNNLELIAHNFRNNYEACVDSFGEIWCSDNDDDGNQQTRICFVMPGGNYGYGPRGPGQSHWHEEQPGIVHKVLRTGFGSPCGIQFYEGTTLPKQYHNTLMHCDAGPREVRAFTRKPKGAGYELDKANMLTSTDGWFRPVDVCTAPDGSVFVADWYDPGVGGHGMGDHTRGRVYRLSPAGSQGYKVPEVKLGTKDDFIETIGSPNLAVRTIAASYFNSLDFKKMIPLSTSRGYDNDISLIRSIWLSSKMINQWNEQAKEDAELMEVLLKSVGEKKRFPVSKTFIQKSMTSVLKMSPSSIKTVLANPSVSELSSDSKARQQQIVIYRDILLEMHNAYLDDTKYTSTFYSLAKLYDGQDHFYRAALNIACGTDPARRDAILADFEKHFPEWNDKVADLVWELRPKSMLPKMGQLLTSDKITPGQKARIVDILAVNDSPEAGKTLLNLLSGEASPEVKASAINNLKLFLPTKWAELKKGDAVKKAMKELFASKQQFFAMNLAVAAPECCDLGDIQKTAKDASLHPELRREAVVTCGKIRTAELTKFLTTLASDAELGSVAVNALGNHITGQGTDDISKLALGTLEGMLSGNSTTELKKTAIEALAGTRAGTGWLLKQKEAGKLPEALSADAGRLLRNSPFQGERNKAMILFPAPGKLNPKNLPSPAVLATKKGDAASGQKLMAASIKNESQCLKCHMVRGQGGQIGPDLSMIGKKGTRENLFESILNPSKAIADQYVSWKIDTADGQTITGLLINETETSLTIRDANGKDYPVALKDIDKRSKSLISIMPEGLAATFTEEELIDIVEFMTTLQTASLTPDSWLIAGPFPGASMEAALAEDHKPKDFKLVKLTTAYMDLAALHGAKANNSASYAMKEIESPIAQDATILLGTDDGAKLWVNGVEVFETHDTKAAAPEQHAVKVKLKPGVNKVMLKVANGNNPHGFYFTITSPEALKAK